MPLVGAHQRDEDLLDQLRSFRIYGTNQSTLEVLIQSTLLVWGELDARSPLRIAHEFERTIPNATLVVIPECSHVTNLDRPDEFNRAVREFCLRHLRSGD